MLNQTLFKRIIPFIAALAFGLFVASFFVNIVPSFDKYDRSNKSKWSDERKKRKHKHKCKHRDGRKRYENRQFNERIILLDDVVTVPADSVSSTKK